MLVLTGMDYSKKDTLYDQAKQSLKKCEGDQTSCVTLGNSNASMPVKLEPIIIDGYRIYSSE